MLFLPTNYIRSSVFYNDFFLVFYNACFWVFFSYMAAPPPYNPYAGYPVPPVPMASPSPVPGPTAYAPVQVINLDLGNCLVRFKI